MRVFLVCVLAVVSAGYCFGLDVSGKWNGTVELKAPDGQIIAQPAWAEFRQSGNEISGTAGGGDSDESLAIERGRFDGKGLVYQFTGLDGWVYKARLVLQDRDRLEGVLDFELPDGTRMTAKLSLKSDTRH